MEGNGTGAGDTIKQCLNLRSKGLRARLLEIENEIREIKSILVNKDDDSIFFQKGANVGECIAQLTIGLRDLESSRMRLGKVIQYNSSEQTSIYDVEKKV